MSICSFNCLFTCLFNYCLPVHLIVCLLVSLKRSVVSLRITRSVDLRRRNIWTRWTRECHPDATPCPTTRQPVREMDCLCLLFIIPFSLSLSLSRSVYVCLPLSLCQSVCLSLEILQFSSQVRESVHDDWISKISRRLVKDYY